MAQSKLGIMGRNVLLWHLRQWDKAAADFVENDVRKVAMEFQGGDLKTGSANLPLIANIVLLLEDPDNVKWRSQLEALVATIVPELFSFEFGGPYTDAWIAGLMATDNAPRVAPVKGVADTLTAMCLTYGILTITVGGDPLNGSRLITAGLRAKHGPEDSWEVERLSYVSACLWVDIPAPRVAMKDDGGHWTPEIARTFVSHISEEDKRLIRAWGNGGKRGQAAKVVTRANSLKIALRRPLVLEYRRPHANEDPRDVLGAAWFPETEGMGTTHPPRAAMNHAGGMVHEANCYPLKWVANKPGSKQGKGTTVVSADGRSMTSSVTGAMDSTGVPLKTETITLLLPTGNNVTAIRIDKDGFHLDGDNGDTTPPPNPETRKPSDTEERRWNQWRDQWRWLPSSVAPYHDDDAVRAAGSDGKLLEGLKPMTNIKRGPPK